MIKTRINMFFNYLLHVKETVFNLNVFYIGKNLYIILENVNHDKFITSPLIFKIHDLGFDINYYPSYYDLECDEKSIEFRDFVNFIVIG